MSSVCIPTTMMDMDKEEGRMQGTKEMIITFLEEYYDEIKKSKDVNDIVARVLREERGELPRPLPFSRIVESPPVHMMFPHIVTTNDIHGDRMGKGRKDGKEEDVRRETKHGVGGVDDEVVGEDNVEEDGVEEDGVGEDNVEEDGVEEDGVEEDGVEEDGVEEDNVVEDGCNGDGPVQIENGPVQKLTMLFQRQEEENGKNTVVRKGGSPVQEHRMLQKLHQEQARNDVLVKQGNGAVQELETLFQEENDVNRASTIVQKHQGVQQQQGYGADGEMPNDHAVEERSLMSEQQEEEKKDGHESRGPVQMDDEMQQQQEQKANFMKIKGKKGKVPIRPLGDGGRAEKSIQQRDTLEKDTQGICWDAMDLHSPCMLRFRHTCNFDGCREEDCELCAQAVERKCIRHFCVKYHVGEHMTTACGASVFVDSYQELTGLLHGGQGHGEYVVGVLNAAMVPKAEWSFFSEEELQQALVKSNTNKEPILTYRDLNSADGILRVPTDGSPFDISTLTVNGSSESILECHNGKFVLFVALEITNGPQKTCSTPLLSQPFAVTSVRVKSARKREILHVNDNISKVNALGKAAQRKLASLRSYMQDPLLRGVPFDSIRKVGELKQVFRWLDMDPKRESKFRRALSICRGWEEAKKHTLKAVTDDFRVRLWTDDSHSNGLVYGCEKSAIPNLENPIALLTRTENGEYVVISTEKESETHSLAQYGISLQQMMHYRSRATTSWFVHLHPGWSILPMTTDNFKLVIGQHLTCTVPESMMQASLRDKMSSSLDAIWNFNQNPVTQSFSPQQFLVGANSLDFPIDNGQLGSPLTSALLSDFLAGVDKGEYDTNGFPNPSFMNMPVPVQTSAPLKRQSSLQLGVLDAEEQLHGTRRHPKAMTFPSSHFQ